MGVYRMGVSGLKKGNYESYAAWLNRPAIWGEDYQILDSWENIEGQAWQLGPWSEWVHAKAGRRLVLAVTLLPGTWDGKGPKQGKDAGIPVSLEEGAKGTYNEHFRKLAENLVKFGLDDTILRLGPEFNAGWTNHRALHKEAAFAEYWRQIVNTMRAVPGAGKLQFCWNPANNLVQGDALKSWPGEEYVDYIGVDVYDQSRFPGTYPILVDDLPEDIRQRREAAWNNWIFDAKRQGLAMWSDFARKHHRPLAIPEWGVVNRKDGYGGMDNPYFIEQMYKFITDPVNNVAFHCYFQASNSDGSHKLISEGDFKTEFPNAATRFKELFGLPESRSTGADAIPSTTSSSSSKSEL